MVVKIMIGLPASGKSTYIKDNKQEDDLVLSSDEIRLELFWDESSQENNWLVFDTLFKRLLEWIKKWIWNIRIDVTNITIKNRRKIFNIIWKKNIGVVWIIHELPILELIERDKFRERTVWEDIIMRMVWQYQYPKMEEWFSEIWIVDDIPEERDETNLDWYINFIKDNKFIQNMKWLEQNNYYHQETLSEHLKLIENQIYEDNINYKLLILLIMFHDIWKILRKKN